MILVVNNMKGGGGKTTICHELITGLQMKGYSVLAVDLDIQ